MQPLRELFGSILERAGPERARALRLRVCWRLVAGPMLAARARAEVAGDAVVLWAQDARWAAQIANLGPLLRARLSAEIGPVERIDVRVDPDRAHTRAEAAGGARPAEPATARSPRIAAAAAAIADPLLRARLEETAAEYLAATRSRGGES